MIGMPVAKRMNGHGAIEDVNGREGNDEMA
jgi:hypothetical protein